MHIDYIISSEAEEKLKTAGLIDKITGAIETDGFHWAYYNHTGIQEVHSFNQDLAERGYFKAKHVSKEIYKEYLNRLSNCVNNPKKNNWLIRKPDKQITEPYENDDFPLLNGYFASLVLEPEEFWDHVAFGFDSHSDLHGTIGACMKMKKSNHMPWREGYKWETEVDETKFISEVSGSNHGDLRISRTDVTFYESFDPLGNQISYRPIFYEEQQNVAAYHSTEPGLLATVLKYADQFNIPSEILEDKEKKLLEEFEGKAHRFGNFADAGWDTPGSERHHFVSFCTPFVNIDDMSEIALRITDNTITESGGCYRIYSDGDKGLIFSYSKDFDDKNRQVSFQLPSNEIDHLIRGLFVQASKGLGRTSVQQLVNVMKYRFSDEFEKDIEEDRKFIEKMRKEGKIK